MQRIPSATTFRRSFGGLALLLVLSQPALAADAWSAPDAAEIKRQQYESSGVLGGLAIGALAGGPIGAVASAVAGGWLGNKVHEARDSRIVREDLELARHELERLQASHLALSQQLAQKNLVASTTVPQAATVACCQDSALTLHFRSNSSGIEPHYLPALREFVRLTNGLDSVVVEISGHSDRRGTDPVNLALAQQRVQSVEKTLRDMGLRQVRVETLARGEQQPVSALDDPQGRFFDRRVQLRLRQAERHELLSSTQR
jgi:outer membrane protein OmpA-like peptidoglycan-associated protein